MKIAALQMVSGPDVSANLSQAHALLANAAAQGAELAALPEYFCLMGQADSDKLRIAEPFGSGPIQQFLADAAREFKLWIVGGTLPLATPYPTHVRNSVLVYAPSGECVVRYDKVHLFRFDNGRERYDESHVLERGDQPVRFALPSRDGHTWQIGLSVCYDLRFPELYRQLKADLVLVPSAFTHTTGQAHWEVLLRARAIENLAYVLAPAQGGVHPNGRHTWGHSMLVQPWGEVQTVLPQGEGVVVGDVQMPVVQQARTQLPALQHRVF